MRLARTKSLFIFLFFQPDDCEITSDETHILQYIGGYLEMREEVSNTSARIDSLKVRMHS